MKYQGVIFDLDGVIVTTDEYHYLAWKKMADAEFIPFDKEINERLRGVSRMESLEIILEKSSKTYTDDEKTVLADRKNSLYRESLNLLTPDDLLPGVRELLNNLRNREIPMAIGSSSRNTPVILEKIGLDDFFDAVADGNMIVRSKPNPEVFLLAAEKLDLNPHLCVVIEDADAGIEAALAAGCKAVGVGAAADNAQAHMKARNLVGMEPDKLLG